VYFVQSTVTVVGVFVRLRAPLQLCCQDLSASAAARLDLYTVLVRCICFGILCLYSCTGPCLTVDDSSSYVVDTARVTGLSLVVTVVVMVWLILLAA
jgi:hypothetical protein